jgi:hypothetical protein
MIRKLNGSNHIFIAKENKIVLKSLLKNGDESTHNSL